MTFAIKELSNRQSIQENPIQHRSTTTPMRPRHDLPMAEQMTTDILPTDSEPKQRPATMPYPDNTPITQERHPLCLEHE